MAHEIEKAIESALRIASGNRELVVLAARKGKEDEYLYAAFKNEKDADQYSENKYDNEEYTIFNVDGRYGFAYCVFNPGFRYRRDGTGEPDEYELKEHRKTYDNLKACVYALAFAIIGIESKQKSEIVIELLCEYQDSLNFIDHD